MNISNDIKAIINHCRQVQQSLIDDREYHQAEKYKNLAYVLEECLEICDDIEIKRR